MGGIEAEGWPCRQCKIFVCTSSLRQRVSSEGGIKAEGWPCRQCKICVCTSSLRQRVLSEGGFEAEGWPCRQCEQALPQRDPEAVKVQDVLLPGVPFQKCFVCSARCYLYPQTLGAARRGLVGAKHVFRNRDRGGLDSPSIAIASHGEHTTSLFATKAITSHGEHTASLFAIKAYRQPWRKRDFIICYKSHLIVVREERNEQAATAAASSWTICLCLPCCTKNRAENCSAQVTDLRE
eukprot:1145511-Pelagomonas_calceolata.AAC.5